MKTTAIMQPTYLPWLGYFDLIDQSDVFVFLDSVQFDKRSWQQRNRIKSPNGELFLTVPVLSKGKREQSICDVEIDCTQNFKHKHLKAISHNLSKAPFYSTYYNELKKIYDQNHTKLADLNISLIKWFSDILGIKCEFIHSSLLNVTGKKVDLLVNICKKVSASTYISPIGSKNYIEENSLFHSNGLTLIYQQYEPDTYTQQYGEFIPYLSILDLLFNEGENSLNVIRTGRRI